MHYLLLALNKWIYLIQVASGECFFLYSFIFCRCSHLWTTPYIEDDLWSCEQPRTFCICFNLWTTPYILHLMSEQPLIFCSSCANTPLYSTVYLWTLICGPWSVKLTEPFIFCSYFENDPLYLADVLICEWSLIFCSWFVNTPYILQLICESWFVNNPSYLSPDLWTTPYIKQMVWFVNDPFMSFIFAADL